VSPDFVAVRDEAQDVHAWLTEQTEQPALGVQRDQALHDGLVELARLGHATHLVEGGRRADEESPKP